MVEQARERLAEAHEPEVVQHLDEVPRIEEVHHGVLDTADVLIDRHPLVDRRAIERRLAVVGVAVAEEVPRRVDEGVHRVGFAPALPAAARARNPDPILRGCERRAALRGVVIDLRQEDGQLVLRDGHDPAPFAVDDRDRTPPVPLP